MTPPLKKCAACEFYKVFESYSLVHPHIQNSDLRVGICKKCEKRANRNVIPFSGWVKRRKPFPGGPDAA